MQKKLSLKILVIFLIGLLLMIPLFMISDKIAERQNYLDSAKYSVAQNWTGPQRLITPILVLPYVTERTTQYWDKKSASNKMNTVRQTHVKLILAQQLDIDADLVTDIRYKGIYQVPVYNAKISVSGEFDQQAIKESFDAISRSADFKHFSTPYLSTIVSDARGISNIPTLSWNKQRMKFAPGSRLKAESNGLHVVLPLSALNHAKSAISTFSYAIDLRGMEQLDFIPVAAQSEVKVSSNWAHPAFVGNFLPAEREISDQGYKAQWRISSFASNISEKLSQCAQNRCDNLFNTRFGVKQIEPISIYVQAERSVKYGILFIGLSFIAFFIFEVIKKLAIHAIQYTLVGFSIAIFYLLLISLSEHITFAAAYCIATVSCISLLFYYLRYVLQDFKDALVFATLLSVLYAVLYVIISAEDFALLMGALLTFITLALVMICTRNIDWYSLVDIDVEKRNAQALTAKASASDNASTTQQE